MAKNEVTKTNTSISPMQQYQIDLVLEVERGLQEMGQKLTEYGKQCVINALAAIIITTKNNSIPLNSLDQTMLKLAIRNVGLLELNFNAIPSEAFIDMRRGEGGKYSISIRPQGAGNEKLTRRFGVNVQELKTALLVREGDEYTLPGFDGEKMTPFTWKPKSLDNKVIMIVYPLLKKDGTYEYLMATRDSIVPNLIAQIRQNNLYTFKKTNKKGEVVVDVEKREEFYDKLNKAFDGKTLDQILADPEWQKELSNTYTSGGSKEAMVIRKMKNNALKNYPREFNNAVIANAVKEINEDYDESLDEKPQKVDGGFIDVNPVEKVEKEIAEEPEGNAVPDFDVSSKEEKSETKTEPSPKAEEKETKDNYEEEF